MSDLLIAEKGSHEKEDHRKGRKHGNNHPGGVYPAVSFLEALHMPEFQDDLL
jgi:hypothetical protein